MIHQLTETVKTMQTAASLEYLQQGLVYLAPISLRARSVVARAPSGTSQVLSSIPNENKFQDLGYKKSLCCAC
jgi:hypothetical protein